jgi:sugar lactone lactonase YvrE
MQNIGNGESSANAAHTILAVLLAVLLALPAGSAFAAATVTTLAGNGTSGAVINGPENTAQFQLTLDVAVDSGGNAYVPDYGNHVIRKITPAGVVSTFAGTGTAGGTNGPAATALFNLPRHVAVDGSDNVYVFDYVNQLVRKITPSGTVSALAGSGAQGYANATGSAASFYNSEGLAADSAGNVYVADTFNQAIRKISPVGVVTTLAGPATQGGVVIGWVDGPGPTALFNNPQGVAVDSSGNVYVGDTLNNRIRKITPAGTVSTLAGTGAPGWVDGPAATAQFYNPWGVAVDGGGNVYVADMGNNRIRKITPAGIVSTLAGSGVAGFADGAAVTARFSGPSKVAVNSPGSLVYVADQGNNRIRTIADDSVAPQLLYEYAVKFVCGVKDPATSSSNPSPVVAQGAYFTAINVHNPNAQPVSFKNRFVIALPGEQQGGKISAFFPAALIADEAFEIECPDILQHLNVQGFVKGFVVIQSPSEFDVVAVYTAAATPIGPVVTLEIERVPVRKK